MLAPLELRRTTSAGMAGAVTSACIQGVKHRAVRGETAVRLELKAESRADVETRAAEPYAAADPVQPPHLAQHGIRERHRNHRTPNTRSRARCRSGPST